MSYFPIKIEIASTGKIQKIKSPEELPNGETFKVIETNIPDLQEDEYKEFLSNIHGIVEANSFEDMYLCQEWCKNKKLGWERPQSLFVTVGKIEGRDICISLTIKEINGYDILFLDATSALVDWNKIEEWLLANCPKQAFRCDGVLNKENAMNFVNVLPLGACV